ncbi:MAG: hypothetical protein JEZ04_19580 [Spirochaetales bacterium]|nr:hypothetical protein [Spirochaetales bacterium]
MRKLRKTNIKTIPGINRLSGIAEDSDGNRMSEKITAVTTKTTAHKNISFPGFMIKSLIPA